MEESQSNQSSEQLRVAFIPLSEVKKTNFDIKRLVNFDDQGVYEIKGDKYIEKVQDKESTQEMIRIAVTFPMINGIRTTQRDNVQAHIKSPYLDEEKQEFYLPVIQGGYHMKKPAAMLDKAVTLDSKVIPYDDTEVHEHVHAAEHEMAFYQVFKPWMQGLVTALKEYDPGINTPEEGQGILEEYYKKNGNYNDVLNAYINKTLGYGKAFHDKESGKEVRYHIQNGIEERDPRSLYEYAKANYSEYPVLMRKVHESEARYDEMMKLREEKATTDRLEKSKRLKDEHEVFQENKGERDESTQMVKRILKLFEGGTKEWSQEFRASMKNNGSSIFELTNNGIKLSKEDQARLQDVYKDNKHKIDKFASNFEIGARLATLVSHIDNAEIVDWSQKRTRNDTEEGATVSRSFGGV